MNIKYLIDENQRGVLWHVIQKHNARGIDTIADNDRILVTFDKKTMPTHLNLRLSSGLDHPGLFILRRDDIPLQTLSFLVATAHASHPEEWRNMMHFIP